MNMNEKKNPESPLPEHSSQQQLTDEEMEQVAGGRVALEGPCQACGTRRLGDFPCPNPDCPTNKK